MLGLGTTPVTQAAAGSPVTVSVMPHGTTPLLGLADGAIVQPVDAALPELQFIGDPVAAPIVPDVEAIAPAAIPVPETPAVPVAALLSDAPAATLADAHVPTARPVPAPSPSPAPEGARVTARDAQHKTSETVQVPVLETVPAADNPDEPAKAAQPVPAPAPLPVPALAPAPDGKGDGGTATTLRRSDTSVEFAPVAGLSPVVEPTPQPVQGAPAVPSTGESVRIDAPVREISEPETAPIVDDRTAPVADSSRNLAGPVPEVPIAPAETALMAAPVEAPVVSEAVADPLFVATSPDAPVPQVQPVAPAAISLAVPTADTNPAPLQPELEAAAPAAPRAAEPARAPEPARSDGVIDVPDDDGAFEGMVTDEPVSDADADADAGTMRTSGNESSDTMNRDGSRQPTPQQSAPTPPPSSTAPIAAFDPLAAAPAPDAARATSDVAAAEPRARASAIGEDVGLAIVRHADTGSGDVLVIRLDPGELGKIEVRLRMDEARQLTAEVTADQPATLDLLRRDSDSLTRALNDAGFRADDQSLRFDSRGFGQNEQQAQQGRRVANRAYLSEDDASASSIPSPVQVRSSGRVDLVA